MAIVTKTLPVLLYHWSMTRFADLADSYSLEPSYKWWQNILTLVKHT